MCTGGSAVKRYSGAMLQMLAYALSVLTVTAIDPTPRIIDPQQTAITVITTATHKLRLIRPPRGFS
jgi:hypothetical protein